MALGFRDEQALRVVLMSGLCPPEVQATGARVGRSADGGVVLVPDRPLPAGTLAALRGAGVAMDAALPIEARTVGCWAEAVALERVPRAELPALALLTTADATGTIDLAAELLRLGCERQELQLAPGAGLGGLIRVTDAPTYTLMRALDRDGGLRAYGPDPVGQERVFCELGYRHPLAGRLAAAPGELLLVGPDGWRSVRDEGWRGLEHALALAIPGERVDHQPTPVVARRRVELRLSPGRREAASLWVLRAQGSAENGVAEIDRLLGYLPEDVVARLTFAVAGELVILRARTSRHPPPDLALAAEVYAPLAQLPDVYAPAGAIVEPPLRRERLRGILGVESGQIAWLAPTAAGDRGPFRVERIADSAFQPLAEWAEYVLHASAPELAPWLRAAAFEFAPYVSTGLEWAQEPRLVTDDAAGERSRPRVRRARPAAEPPPVAPEPAVVAPAAAAERARPRDTAVVVEEAAVDRELVELEQAFLALDAPADARERLDLLDRLAAAYLRLGRHRDASLCFARAVWERAPADATARFDAWIAAEAGRDPAAALAAALAQAQPSGDDVRRVAALAARADEPVRRDPHRVQRWLDDHDGELDARSLWLARLGLARLAGGDALGLATARDRILARLAGGLPVERELPSFLRFAGRSGALGNASGEQLAAALDKLAEKIQTTRRKRSPVEAPAGHTGAYVMFQLAHGYARIGNPERARALAHDAATALGAQIGDPVHGYLVAAFGARVEQAISGLPPETPLPEPLNAQLAGLDRVMRYKVDRLREASRILEPLERPDAIGAFSRRLHDARGPEFAALRGLPDAGARATEIDRLIGLAAAAGDDEGARLIDGCLDMLLELPEARAVPLLRRALPLIGGLPEIRRAVLYAEALVVAGHFGRTELIPALLADLGAAVRVVQAPELARVLDQSLRALRRIGLRHEIAELLAGAEAATATGTANLGARLALAGGLAYLGDTTRALPILDQARKALGETMTLTARLELTRQLAQAYAQAPLGHALGGITELATQLRDITDSFGTNSHYCLSVLHFVESLVLGITSDDLALGEVGRRFVEDDEHLIRRRLHRDLGGTA